MLSAHGDCFIREILVNNRGHPLLLTLGVRMAHEVNSPKNQSKFSQMEMGHTYSVKRSAFPATSVISLKWNDYKKHAEGE